MLQIAELFRLFLFFISLISVVVLAVNALFEVILERLSRLTCAVSRRRILLRRIILAVAALGLACIAYGYWIEPYWPEVTRVTITSTKLRPGALPIRIVHISDLHCDPRPRLEERLPELITAQRPHLIIYTGDSLNIPAGLPILKRLMTRLSEIAPTYVVQGNWDVWFWKNLDLFGGTGVTELNGTSTTLEIEGSPLWIAGSAIEQPRHLRAVLEAVPPTAFSLLLYHYPDEILTAAAHGIDLYCAGHTHGGQVALPFYGALLTSSAFGKRFERGLYRVNQTWLYVNRGIGMEGGLAPRVRFWARPEVTLITLVPAAPGGSS